MAEKCPTCGAPLNGNHCDYCGYSFEPTSQQTNVQSQIIINNQTVTNQRTRFGISGKSKTTTLLLCIFLEGLEYIDFTSVKSERALFIFLRQAFLV